VRRANTSADPGEVTAPDMADNTGDIQHQREEILEVATGTSITHHS